MLKNAFFSENPKFLLGGTQRVKCKPSDMTELSDSRNRSWQHSQLYEILNITSYKKKMLSLS